MAGPERQSIAAWPNDIDSTEMIPLGITTEQEGYVSFTMPLIERMPANRHFYLYDKEAAVTHDLHQTTPYRLFLRKGSFDTRFFLVLKNGDDGGPSKLKRRNTTPTHPVIICMHNLTRCRERNVPSRSAM